MATCDWTVILCNPEISSTHGKTQPSPQMEVMKWSEFVDFVDFVQIQVRSLQKRKARAARILKEEKKIAHSMDPFQFGHFIDMSRNRNIQSWHLRLLLLDEWKDTSRSESNLKLAAHLKTFVATEGMRKLRPKKRLRCGRDKKIHVQKSIRFQFNRKGSS